MKGLFLKLLSLFPIRLIIVRGKSMGPAIPDGTHVLIHRFAHMFRSPQIGDVVTILHPHEKRTLIKRIIALPGQWIRTGEETYVLKGNEYFVMGDNFLESTDSRSFGPVTRGMIRGRVVAK